MNDETVTLWLSEIQEGDPDAAEKLWNTYFQRLVLVGRSMLGDAPRQAADEEDVALSAFNSFCLRAVDGRFPRLRDRDDLWKLLFTITVRKAQKQARRENLRRSIDDAASFFCESFAGPDVSRHFISIVDDTMDHLLKSLHDSTLVEVAIAKCEGYSNAEIAAKIGKSISTVERKLQLIRRIWSSELQE